MNNGNAFELYGKYKNLYLFNTGKGSVLFKPLSYSKCETAKRICQAYPALAPIVEDNIWEECVVEHTLRGTINTLNAGVVSTIVRLILGFSNPTSEKEIQEELSLVRDSSMNLRDEIIVKICQAFPAYTPEEVEDMEWKTQMRRLVQAEKILGTTFDFVSNPKTNKVDKARAPAMKKGADGQEYIDFSKENQTLI